MNSSPSGRLTNWAGNITFAASALHLPATVEALQHLVASRHRIRALGTGHCFNRIADTRGELVSLADLELPIEIDGNTRTAVVPAGKRYAEVAGTLDGLGWALHNLGSLPHISVAGACATGTHGSGDRNRNLSSAVEAVEFIRADGEVVRLSRVANPNRFGGAVLSLGALGVLTRLTLSIEPSFDVRQDVYLDMPVDVAAEHASEIFGAGYSVSMFIDWRQPDLINAIWLKRRVDHDSGPAEGDWFGAPLADRPQHPIPGLDAAAATTQLGQVGRWHERLPHFRADFTPSHGEELQSEYFLPRNAAADAIQALRAIAARFLGPLAVCEIRTIAADDLWLSPCHGRDTVALHFTWVRDLDAVLVALASIEAAIAPFDARPHWGKVFRVPPAKFEEIYPQLPAFRALAAEYDPNRKFGNSFLETYVHRC